MSLDKYRNEICRCGSGKKFKRCCLVAHNKTQAALVIQQAKDRDEEEAIRLNRQYGKVKRGAKKSDENSRIP